jgi:UPF0176 protein
VKRLPPLLLHRGFKNVFHLEGGIIHYTNQVKEKGLTNKFHGKNFVFDQRLGERITNEVIANCHQCGKPADTHVNCVNVPVTFYLFSATIAGKNMKIAAARNARILFICRKNSKKNCAKELTKAETCLINQKAGY